MDRRRLRSRAPPKWGEALRRNQEPEWTTSSPGRRHKEMGGPAGGADIPGGGAGAHDPDTGDAGGADGGGGVGSHRSFLSGAGSLGPGSGAGAEGHGGGAPPGGEGAADGPCLAGARRRPPAPSEATPPPPPWKPAARAHTHPPNHRSHHTSRPPHSQKNKGRSAAGGTAPAQSGAWNYTSHKAMGHRPQPRPHSRDKRLRAAPRTYRACAAAETAFPPDYTSQSAHGTKASERYPGGTTPAQNGTSNYSSQGAAAYSPTPPHPHSPPAPAPLTEAPPAEPPPRASGWVAA
ncbi:serine/threonine-protein phosphatase 1 regulatory subunit 10-like [Dromiciops gliroides]|uniref:serine/threonine-protein phosphatase 1 regulatory subunit 10-like n=1 Tax=Dromiciops gliroides TaxID=33562 RepID=UPI001CC4FEC9|nr:serine/threonine-protein phosphatase 1 regulatory subunit 10-like [Dromiciops gliroides]